MCCVEPQSFEFDLNPVRGDFESLDTHWFWFDLQISFWHVICDFEHQFQRQKVKSQSH